MAGTATLLFRGSTLRFMQLIASIAIGFFMMPFLIESLGDRQYGLWIIVGTVISFYSLLDAGMVIATQRFISQALHGKDMDDVNVTISTMFFVFLAIGVLTILITVIVILVGSAFIDSPDDIPLFQKTIAVLSLNVVYGLPCSVFYGVLTAKYRFDLLSYIGLVMLIVRSALIYYFVSIGYSILAIAVITVAVSAIEKLWVIVIAKKLFKELKIAINKCSRLRFYECLNYGKFTFVITAANWIRTSSDDLIVGAMLGLASVTHYTIALTLIKYFSNAISSIFGVIGPVLNKYHKLEQWDNLRYAFRSTTEISSLLAILAGGLFVVIGGDFINLWMGPGYSDSYYVLVILAIGSTYALAQRPSVAILYAIAKHKHQAKITSIEAAANILISLSLVKYFGIYGVAIGTTLPLLVTKLVYQPLYTCKELNFSLMDYYKILIKQTLIGLVVFLPAYYFVHSQPLLYFYQIIISSLLITYIYVLISYRLIHRSTQDYIYEMCPDRFVPMLKVLLLSLRK